MADQYQIAKVREYIAWLENPRSTVEATPAVHRTAQLTLDEEVPGRLVDYSKDEVLEFARRMVEA